MKTSANFPLSDLKTSRPISGWEEYLHDGKAFLKTAAAAYAGRKRAFTPEILYNLVAMAIEKFVMAALMRHGTLPYNHTMKDLVEAMEATFPEAIADIREGMLRLDAYQEICDVDTFKITPPAMEDIPAMLELAGRLQGLTEKELLAGKSEK